ncbi:MAG TPA: WbqC family protein [Bacteroidia bacterium]|nr:WbqC family protein [Bacteroidia bacterium]
MHSTLAILPVAYLAPISHYAAMATHPEVQWDIHEHFHKQFFYNRCVISGPNGILKLTIPISHDHERTAVKDIRISYESPWQKLHWRSFEASYRRSPYFEYYEETFRPIYEDYKPEYLIEWNRRLFDATIEILKSDIKLSYTGEYHKLYEGIVDYRSLASPNILASKPVKEVKYLQVFEDRHGFIPDLSIIDLLCCEGPHAMQLLKN